MKTKFKKLTSVLITAIMIFGIFTIIPFTASAATSGDFEYTILDDGTAEITAYTGSDVSLTIPSQLDGYTVTSIGKKTFYKNTSLTSVVFPDSITNIGSYAFQLSKVTTLKLGNGITNIGNYALAGITQLTSLTFGSNLKTIGDYAFTTCSSLTNITIPDGVTSIGMQAFGNCKSLESVSIPDSVTSISGTAFGSGTLKSKILTDQPDGVTYVDGWVCGYNGTMPENTSIVLKDGTRGIADSALYYNDNIIDVTIPDSLKYMGKAAFSNCTALTSVTIGDGLASISTSAFSECTSLTEVTFGSSVTSIGASAFYACTALTDFTIPDTVTEIGETAFSLCTSLNSVTIPESVTYIDSTAFNNRSETLTIYGYSGSAAETFAAEKEIPFVSLGEAVTTILGDVNYDGKITIDDATDIQKHLANIIEFTEEQETLADVDKSGKVSIDDVTLIQKHLAGLAVIGEGDETTNSVTSENTVTTDTTPSATQSNYNQEYADEVIRLVNIEREKEGLEPLSKRQDVTEIAEIRAEEIAQVFSHTRPDGSSCFSLANEKNVFYITVGENIAYGYSTPQEVVEGWMNSSGHRENILSSSFNGIGVGCYNENGTLYWTQFFIGA